nr:pentatricopeptide repeat protein AaPPR612 [Agave angustifolia]
MVEENSILLNSVTVACVVLACAKLQYLESGDRTCAHVADSGIGFNMHLVNSLVDMYMKCMQVEKAERLFNECVDRNIVLFNTMVTNYARLGLANQALALFNEMLGFGPRPDRVTVVGAVSASALLGELKFGRRLHGYIIRNGLASWEAVSNSVIDMYMKCGDPDSAFSVFELMTNRTEVSWNTIINGCIRNGDFDLACRYFDIMPIRDLFSWNTMISALVQVSWFEEAILLFRAMQRAGLKPDIVTMVSISSACGYLGALDLAKWVYAYIDKKRIMWNVKLGTALVDMFAKCGDSKSAMKIFNEMPVKDVSAWTAAIGAMAVEGNGKKALELFNQMVEEGVKPDSVAFVGVLTAFSHGGFVKEGRQFFHSMTEVYGFSPEVVHYGCMVDLLGRAGLLREAQTLIENMTLEPDDVIWGALLAASRIHHHLELAEFAAKKVLELAPERSGIHVLLSNVYASAGKWEDVARVRLDLKDKGIRKLPGSSLIDIDREIHEFTSSDESHPKMATIAKMVDEMSERLSMSGHVPDLANVLMDVDEDEKKFLLSRHSEKMAVAFGLISTSRGVPIHVVKNLRICGDCHEFMKLVSGIYSREITIRDNNRFHYFREGKCSCNDYW